MSLRTPLLLALPLLVAVPGAAAQDQVPDDFGGRALVAVSDTDMLASAYVDGLLGAEEGRDALSVIAFGKVPSHARVGRAEVSNSVAGPPTAVAVTPDGRFALAVETFAPRASGAAKFTDLRPGSQLMLIDLADPGAPRVVQRIAVGTRPTSVTVSPDGSMIAVALHPEDGRQLALVPLSHGRLGAPSYVALPGVAKTVETPHVEWHPSGRYLAATLLGRNEVVFFAVAEGTPAGLRAWGRPVKVGKYPMMGRFTPDGRHFVNVNLYWGDDVDGFWVGAPRGDVTVTAFDASAGSAAPQHRIVSRAQTGVSPEGVAISADGRRIVTTNLERSYLPRADRRLTHYSSLTLLSLDPATGRLTSHGESLFDGILPESAVFDTTGRYLATATFDHFDDAKSGGSIDFWRIIEDSTSGGPRLVKTGASVAVPRGPHSMALVPR